MNVDQSIRVCLVDTKRRPLEVSGVFLTIFFFTSGNRRYGFRVGPTDSRGHVVISYDEIEEMRRKKSHFQLMDFNTSLDECDDDVEIDLPSMNELQAAHDIVASFGEPSFMREADEWLSGANGRVRKGAVRSALQPQGETRIELLTSLQPSH